MVKDDDYKKLVSENRRLEEHLMILYKGAREILKLSNFEKTAKKLFGFCKQITGATAGYVALLTDDGEENKLLFLDSGGADCKVDPYLPMPVRGLREKAYREKRTVYHNDFSNTGWTTFLPEGHMQLRNVLFAPLIVKDKAVGLIGLSNKQGDFSSYDAYIAGAFGNLAASALQNSILFEEIRKQNAGKEKLISIMSHDIKNQINCIQGFSDLLIENIERNDTGKIKKFAGIISSSSSDANQLLDDLLIWAKTASGKLTFNPQKINLEELIKDLAKKYKKIAEVKEINLTVEIETSLNVLADEKMLATVLRNLLSNAIKFTGQNGRIVIAAKPEKEEAEISVTDNGMGMSRQQIDNLLNTGETDNSAGKVNETGTGIGLMLCMELLEKHNKKLRIDSEPGKGSRFYFRLPLSG